MFLKFATKLLLFFRLHKILGCFFHFHAIILVKKPFFSKKFPKFALKLFTTSKQHKFSPIQKEHTQKRVFEL